MEEKENQKKELIELEMRKLREELEMKIAENQRLECSLEMKIAENQQLKCRLEEMECHMNEMMMSRATEPTSNNQNQKFKEEKEALEKTVGKLRQQIEMMSEESLHLRCELQDMQCQMS